MTTQYQRDLNYVKKQLRSIHSSVDLMTAKLLKRGFIDKYSILVSPTDITWLSVIMELDKIEMEQTKKFTSQHLFQ